MYQEIHNTLFEANILTSIYKHSNLHIPTLKIKKKRKEKKNKQKVHFFTVDHIRCDMIC